MTNDDQQGYPVKSLATTAITVNAQRSTGIKGLVTAFKIKGHGLVGVLAPDMETMAKLSIDMTGQALDESKVKPGVWVRQPENTFYEE